LTFSVLKVGQQSGDTLGITNLSGRKKLWNLAGRHPDEFDYLSILSVKRAGDEVESQIEMQILRAEAR
jgi:hypothetical protein